MRVTDIFNPYDLLCESLTTDFTIGFELEAVADCHSEESPWANKSGYLPSYHSGSEPRGVYKEIFDYLNDSLGLGEGKIESDGSLRASSSGDKTFEYGSPIIKFSPTNVAKIYKFLQGLDGKYIYTNDSCGFHVHMSVPTLTKGDIAWILCCIASRDDLIKLVTELNTPEDGTINFKSSHYASADFLESLRSHLVNNDLKWVEAYLDQDKYRVLNIHSQGTLEWRGPRNFMNSGYESSIKKFIVNLYTVIKAIGQILDKQEFKGDENLVLNRSEISKLTSKIRNFHTKSENRKDRVKDAMKKRLDQPWFIAKLTPDIVKDLDDDDKISILNAISNKNMIEIFKKMKQEVFNALIKPSSDDAGNVYYIVHKFWSSNGANDEIWKELMNKIKACPYYKALKDYLLKDYFNSINPYLRIDLAKELEITSEDFNEYIVKAIKNIAKGDNYKLDGIRNKLNNLNSSGYKINVPIEYYQKLMQTNITKMYKLDEIPLKVQRMMIRKSPYNIQYIRHPAPEIVNYLKTNHPEALEDIIGEH